MGDAEASTRTPTRSQQQLVAALANPQLKTKRAVAQAVGVAESTVYRALDNATIKAELERLKVRRTDKARGLKARSLERCLERVESPEIEDTTLALYAKVGHEIAKDSPEEEAAADPGEIVAVIRRACRLAYRLGFVRGRMTDLDFSPLEHDHKRLRVRKG